MITDTVIMPLGVLIARQQYELIRARYVAFIEDKHQKLAKYAESPKASEYAIEQGNREIQAAFKFIEAVDDCIIALTQQAMILKTEKQLALIDLPAKDTKTNGTD